MSIFSRKPKSDTITKQRTIALEAKLIRDKIIYEIYGDDLKYGGTQKQAEQLDELLERVLKSYAAENDPVKSFIQQEADKLAYEIRNCVTHGYASDKIAKVITDAEERGSAAAILINTKEAQSQSYQKGNTDGYLDGAIDMREKIRAYLFQFRVYNYIM